MNDERTGRKQYRLLTGVDDPAFCQKVSDALLDGYVLFGSPTLTFNGTDVMCAQAVVVPDYLPSMVT